MRADDISMCLQVIVFLTEILTATIWSLSLSANLPSITPVAGAAYVCMMGKPTGTVSLGKTAPQIPRNSADVSSRDPPSLPILTKWIEIMTVGLHINSPLLFNFFTR
jgi:hypothetical protein